MSRYIYPIFLIAFCCIGSSCNLGSKPEKQQVTNAAPATPAAPAAANESATAAPTHAPLDTQRLADRAAIESSAAANPAAPKRRLPDVGRSNSAGPPGSVVQNNVPLKASPSQKAATVATLKQRELVNILETIMTDEQGRTTEYPTWYKVELKNKKQGWVERKFIDAGGGG